VRIRAPMMQIHTVAAGGGSICRFDGMRFRVGPESAGANPGPACYRNGGPLTVTDCNLFLGRIDPAQFPAVFGPDGDQPLDPEASRARLQEGADQLDGAKSLEQIADGFLDIAVDNMAAAIRKISIARGHDVTRYTLACFGGAGGQHACRVADALGMERILIHPLAGVLSAYGIGIADVKAIRDASVLRPLSEDFTEALTELEERARDALIDQGVHHARIELIQRARLRTAGSDTTLEIDIAPAEQMRAAFAELHRKRFGYWDEGAEVIVDALAVEAIGSSSRSQGDGEGNHAEHGGGVTGSGAFYPSTIPSAGYGSPPHELRSQGGTKCHHLLDRPEVIDVIYATPEGLPRRFVWRRAVHDITRVEGPERIAPEWWRQPSSARLRDYYRIEDGEGRRYWIYREGVIGDGRGGAPNWFIHGLFG
jgi:5-oxoprolinase (ATP-hydrolysing)